MRNRSLTIPEKQQIATVKVLGPLNRFADALKKALAETQWRDFDQVAPAYYYRIMISQGVSKLVEQNWSDDFLLNFDPMEMEIFLVSLYRDLFRQIPEKIRDQKTDEWVNPFFDIIVTKLNLPPERLCFSNVITLKSRTCPTLAMICKNIGIPTDEVWKWHLMVVTKSEVVWEDSRKSQ